VLTNKSILITGGAGFIGSHLVDALLEQDCDVIVLDNFSTGRPQNLDHVTDKIQLIECDISQKGKWQDYFKGVDWVFHLAALAGIVPSIESPAEYYNSNVNGTFNILEACRQYKIEKIIYSASSSCYGIPDEFPTKETSEIRPQYPYALTKNLGEQLIMHWCQVYNLPAVSLRFFNVYGPKEYFKFKTASMVIQLGHQIMDGKAPRLFEGSDQILRDFINIEDVVQANIKACNPKQNGAYNVGTGNPRSFQDIADLLQQELGTNLGTEYFPNPYDGYQMHTQADISTSQTNLGFDPVVSLEEGIKDYIPEIRRLHGTDIS